MYDTEDNTSAQDIVDAERIRNDKSWADLPDLLLYMIFSRLVKNRHRSVFSTVCKSWNSILQSPSPTKKQFQLNAVDYTSPYLFFSNNKLIHPILDKVYDLKKFPTRIHGTQLCTAKDDWLLFTQNCCSEYDSWYFIESKAFLFNPFTLATIWLPTLLGTHNSICFTSPPTSSNFKVVVVRRTYDESIQSKDVIVSNKIVLDTIKHGENRWTSCEFIFEENSLFKFSYCTPVFCEGMCYILGADSTLLIHDPKEKTFSLQKAPEFLHCVVQEQYLLESDGKLLAVFVETSGSWVLVCQWDVSVRKWEILETLGNKILFVSRPYSFSEISSTIELGNRIYFPRLTGMGDHCLFYSLSDKSFHTSDGSSFTTFHGSKSAFSSTWIKPSCALS